MGAFQTGPAVPQIASAVPDAVSLLEKESKGMLVYLGGGRLVPMVYRTKKVAMPNKEAGMINLSVVRIKQFATNL